LPDFTVELAEPVNISGPEDWYFTQDGLNELVKGTYSVDVIITQAGSTSKGRMHFNWINGEWYWHTDCGDPLE
jgi:hypothetical protein